MSNVGDEVPPKQKDLTPGVTGSGGKNIRGNINISGPVVLQKACELDKVGTKITVNKNIRGDIDISVEGSAPAGATYQDPDSLSNEAKASNVRGIIRYGSSSVDGDDSTCTSCELLDWSDSTVYSRGMMVIYSGSLYWALDDSVDTIPPSDQLLWRLIGAVATAAADITFDNDGITGVLENETNVQGALEELNDSVNALETVIDGGLV